MLASSDCVKADSDTSPRSPNSRGKSSLGGAGETAGAAFAQTWPRISECHGTTAHGFGNTGSTPPRRRRPLGPSTARRNPNAAAYGGRFCGPGGPRAPGAAWAVRRGFGTAAAGREEKVPRRRVPCDAHRASHQAPLARCARRRADRRGRRATRGISGPLPGSAAGGAFGGPRGGRAEGRAILGAPPRAAAYS